MSLDSLIVLTLIFSIVAGVMLLGIFIKLAIGSF